MKHEIKECKHCGTRYLYQVSGYGCQYKTNDAIYCPECIKVIILALENVPKKFENRFVECNDFTKEEAIKESEQYNAGLLLRRVFPSLYDQEAGEFSNDSYFEKNGEKYYLHYWKSREDWKLKKEVRWDILNNCKAD